jgi:predicted permease
MSSRRKTGKHLEPYFWLIRTIGVIVPSRLRADWKQEWQAELQHREALLADWDKLNWRTKLGLLTRSLGAFWDALRLQPKRLEDEMLQDLRYGARMLLRGKTFTAVAVLSLALGIGANTAVFSLIDALLLRALPVREPERLVLFGNADSVGITTGFPNRSWDLFSYPAYLRLRESNNVFSDVAALQSFPDGVHGSIVNNGSISEQKLMVAQLVSGTYFSVLGVSASLGRVFSEADDQIPGGHPLVVVSDSWWAKETGRDPSVIGRTINIGATAYTVIGITPREFFGTTVGEAPDMWVPLAMEEQLPPGRKGRNKDLFQSLNLIARLKDGVTRAQAEAEVNVLFKQTLQEYAGAEPSEEKLRDIQGARIELTPAGSGLSELRKKFSLPLKILMAMVGVVLLIACANVANLLLARAATRQREFAVRLALGASRMRLLRQLLTESVMLAALGGAGGVLLAWWGSTSLVVMVSANSPVHLDVSPDARVLAFTLAVSFISAIAFGTAPALRAVGIALNDSLKAGRGVVWSPSRSLLGKTLVIAQVALSFLLLVGAGLFVRTLINLHNVPIGFSTRNALVFQIDTTATGYKEDAQLENVMRSVEERVEQIPGVRAASFSMFLFNQGGWTAPAYTVDSEAANRRDLMIGNNAVGQHFFTALGLPILQGRGFGPQDTEKTQKIAVISETMARKFFPDQSPLGKRFGLGSAKKSNEIEIIGVVADAKYQSLDEAPQPMAYYPHSQNTSYMNNFEVAVSGDAAPILTTISQAIKEVNPNLPIDEIATLSDHVERSLVQQKLIARLAAFFGLVALLLACIGLYGLLSYAVARRTNEMGIRLALGAQPGTVRRMVLGEGMQLVAIGLAVGLVGAWGVTRLLNDLLYGLSPTDPLTIATATAVLAMVAAVAAYWPARRASRVDPLSALREE